ncbi:MAG: DNA-binding protein WhiA [Firmicutes bacterium]|nr:DNA-binding protein WhiA [Bacillota bacterium]
MRFSTRTKRELAHVIPENRCCRIAELSAFYDFNGYLMRNGSYLDINHFSPLVTRKIFSIIKDLFPQAPTQILTKRAQLRKNQICTVRVLTKEHAQFVHETLLHQKYIDKSLRVLADPCCRRAYVRGAFLSHGSITNPSKTYHLEIFTDKSKVARKVHLTINSLGLESKMTVRKGNIIVYLKNAEQIVTLLNLMGAHNALLKFESIRVLKDMRNQVNRLVNCETANVDKTVQAAIRQIETVKSIEAHMPLSDLPPKLYEIARLRIENPYATLKELGAMTRPPISKSGVNYRFSQLIRISEKLGL